MVNIAHTVYGITRHQLRNIFLFEHNILPFKGKLVIFGRENILISKEENTQTFTASEKHFKCN
jgi:hypothetical protein